MLRVIGGSYREYCVSPQWDQFYGSGLRAAIACAELAGREDPIELLTWVAPSELSEIRLRCESFGIKLSSKKRPEEIQFRYEHPLAPPTVFPSPRELCRHKEQVEVDSVLLFGLLESEVSVRAERLVYDPQAGRDAIAFAETGGIAGEHCTIANLTEAKAMVSRRREDSFSKVSTAIEVARALFSMDEAAAVVVKNGVFGALVASQSGIQLVPSYRTDEVFPIGSGDVFSAAFAYSWAVERFDPHTAAERASRAAALYCGTGCLPLPKQFPELTENWDPMPTEEIALPPTIYLASPLFNVSERWFVHEARRCLEEFGLRVFSPLEHVGCPAMESKTASADLAGLESATVVFAFVDGCDAGTLFELGYATAKGIPIVVYGERIHESDLTMLRGTGTRFFRDFASSIYHVAWMARGL